MKRAFLLAAAAMLIALSVRPQGYFNFSTIGIVRTHVGSIDGLLAGTNIWAQMLAGSTPDALAPVAVPAQHLVLPSGPTGWVNAGAFTVPGIGGFDTAYMEMVVWDGARWGTVLSVVPKDQLGMTDTVPVVLGGDFGPPAASPHFTRSAIVPVPEPSAFRVAVMGAFCALVLCAGGKRLECGSSGISRRRDG